MAGKSLGLDRKRLNRMSYQVPEGDESLLPMRAKCMRLRRVPQSYSSEPAQAQVECITCHWMLAYTGLKTGMGARRVADLE